MLLVVVVGAAAKADPTPETRTTELAVAMTATCASRWNRPLDAMLTNPCSPWVGLATRSPNGHWRPLSPRGGPFGSTRPSVVTRAFPGEAHLPSQTMAKRRVLDPPRSASVLGPVCQVLVRVFTRTGYTASRACCRNNGRQLVLTRVRDPGRPVRLG